MKTLKRYLVMAVVLVLWLTHPDDAPAGQARFAVDAASGAVLEASEADALNHPASLTKMMTLYMTFEAMRAGRLDWDDPVPFSHHAANQVPTKLGGLGAGDEITVREAVMGLIVVSANDAAAALAERLGGTEPRFAEMMTERARRLGMPRTVFRNASGLPDREQVTTAREMATLGLALMRDYPEEYRLFSSHTMRFRGRTRYGHNRLLRDYEGVDGIKTGYTNWSGFNLVTSAERDGARVVAVVLGGRTAKERNDRMARLLDRTLPKAVGAAPLPTLVARSSMPHWRAGTVVATSASAATVLAPVAAAPELARSARPAARPRSFRMAVAIDDALRAALAAE